MGGALELPDTLWDGDRLLIAPLLAASYLESLKTHGLEALAKSGRPDPPPVGGITQQQTDEHYAHAFDGSAARAQLALLDPLGEVTQTAATLLRFLSGGGLCLADVPAGAGAGALSLLCTVAELRRREVMPRVPLSVHLIWGEISEPARNYATFLINNLIQFLEEQAIFVEFENFSWNVLSPLSNTNLIERIVIAKEGKPQTLLLVCNFNGFLERDGKKKEADAQLSELFRYCSGPTNAAVWIEPNMKAAKIALFPWLARKIAALTKFASQIIPGDGNETTNSKFAIPINPQNTAAVRLCVMPFDLVKSAH